jgi:outer membrane protein with beta-barrel domain
MTKRLASKARALLLPLAVLLLAPAMTFADGNANFLIGTKHLDSDDWEPLEDQDALGLELTFGKSTWPINIAVDLFSTSATEDDFTVNLGLPVTVDLEGSTMELDLGARKVWGKNMTRPFLGGGLAVISADLDAEIDQDDDVGMGLWVGGGVFWRIGSRFNIGGSVRYSDVNVNLFDVDGDAGGLTYGVILGWGWPGKK